MSGDAPRPTTSRSRRHLVLWDGECGFCRRAVEWAERRDRGTLEFVAYQQAPSPPMTDALREACARSVHVVTADGRTLKAGRASLFVLSEIGWRTTAAVLRVPPLVWLVELGYTVVARNRALFSKLLPR